MSYFCYNRNRNRPCVSVIFALTSKLGLHLEKLPNPGYVINLPKSYNKDWHRHTNECVVFCCVNIYIYFMFLQTGILIHLEVVSEFSKLAFCYLQCHSQKIIKLLFIWACYVWLLECRVFANTYKFHHNFGLFLKSNSHLSKKIVLFTWLKALLKRWKIFIISP